MKAPAPAKGIRPNVTGVAGFLVDEAPVGIEFGARKRTSPYDPLLIQLREAGPGKFLKFADLRARGSVGHAGEGESGNQRSHRKAAGASDQLRTGDEGHRREAPEGGRDPHLDEIEWCGRHRDNAGRRLAE